ncbi:NAD(P)/FAD-dependent oxidoreductase [Nocardioides nanhaiensis]|uniref:FAD-dependent oxidoreductase n=1 Tax=Nocardioides nanhaiensis TaxID=1476871 RepID=A0ABP8VQR4_9ACTN
MSGAPVVPVVVVGAGISGVACARALQAAGAPVRVVDRGYRIGGRMASKRLDDRAVDLGASYFTVSDPAFEAVAADWRDRGLAEPWTDTFHVVDATAPGGALEPKSGPVRWRAPGALRSLVEDLAAPLEVERAEVAQVDRDERGVLTVDGEPAAAVVLAMPDVQARRLLGPGLEGVGEQLTRDFEPVLALVARFAERSWGFDGVFVNGDDDLAWIVDDGRRRGDDAPVLVAHTTPERAAHHLEDPEGAGPLLVAALRRVLGLPEPESHVVKRWSLARPVGEREEPYLLAGGENTETGLLGVCGDGWGPTPKVEGAYLSGHRLGQAFAERLA